MRGHVEVGSVSGDCAVGIAFFAAAFAFLLAGNSGMVAVFVALGVVFTAKDMRQKHDSD